MISEAGLQVFIPNRAAFIWLISYVTLAQSLLFILGATVYLTIACQRSIIREPEEYDPLEYLLNDDSKIVYLGESEDDDHETSVSYLNFRVNSSVSVTK